MHLLLFADLVARTDGSLSAYIDPDLNTFINKCMASFQKIIMIG